MKNITTINIKELGELNNMQNKQQTVVLATRNVGKAREFENLFKSKNISIATLDDIGFTEEIEETGDSFEENAALKVKAVSGYTQLPVIADDSGLEVDSLKGAPGIYSARYAGEKASDSQNRKKLLDNLYNKQNRSARFVCALAYKECKKEILIVRGECEGKISQIELGENGFGYDSLFIPMEYEKTFGELGKSIKKKLSHRAKAVAELLRLIT